MTSAPSERRLQMQRNVARQQSRDRRSMVGVQLGASAVLLVSTLLAWMNHPRVMHRGGATPSDYVREVSYTIGVATRPAGVIAFIVGAVALLSASQLRKPHRALGWWAFTIGVVAVGTCTGEILQLILGRRNWLSNLSISVVPSPSANAIGSGVWIAAAALLALMVNAMVYLWFEYRARPSVPAHLEP